MHTSAKAPGRRPQRPASASTARPRSAWCRHGCTAVLALASAMVATPSQAALLSFFGWGYSENETYQEVLSYVDAAGNVLGAVGVFNPGAAGAALSIQLVKVAAKFLDPDSFQGIVSGRATLAYDPRYQVLAAGWFGEFGADPGLAAPPVVAINPLSSGIDLLQTSANAAMQHAAITQTPGQVVFEFDWGAPGFVPSRNLSADGHFNFAAVYLYAPEFANATVGSTAQTLAIVGDAAQTAALGTASATYMLCSSGYCGVNPVPEPSTWALLAGGLAAVAWASRLRRRHPRP